MASLIQPVAESYFNYSTFITKPAKKYFNYIKKITNYGSSKFYIKFYYKSQQFQNFYKLRQKLLQITAGITNCSVITMCIITLLMTYNIKII